MTGKFLSPIKTLLRYCAINNLQGRYALRSLRKVPIPFTEAGTLSTSSGRSACNIQKRGRMMNRQRIEEHPENSRGSSDLARTGKHVLVMSLSTFPRAVPDKNGVGPDRTKMPRTDYYYEDYCAKSVDQPSKTSQDQENSPEARKIICSGYYQLEPIPWFIDNALKEYVTDVVLLETEEAKNGKRSFVSPAPTPARDPEQRKAQAVDVQDNEWTVADYFETWLKDFWGSELRIHHIPVNERRPADTIDNVMAIIRELHKQISDEGEWRLWIDTHGSFRDITLALVSAARYFATDNGKPIKTNAILSVYHSQTTKEDLILDQTAFYFAESAEALKRFLDYGQYLSLKFQPYEGNKEHAFISYRHDGDFLTSIRNIFTSFENNGILYWYDDGIRYRDDWRKVLEAQNEKAELFIALLSRSYFESDECWKELIRAVGVRKKALEGSAEKVNAPGSQVSQNVPGPRPGFSTIHFLLLENGMDLKDLLAERLERDKVTPEIMSLRKAMDVTDSDLRNCLGLDDNIQWLQWYKYMHKDVSIRQSLPSDLDGRLKETFNAIKKSLFV